MPVHCPIVGDQLELFDPLQFDLLGCKDHGSTELHPNSLKPGKSCDAHHWIEEKLIRRSGKLHGPYLYLRWRQDGRLKSKYLGKSLYPVMQPPKASGCQPSQPHCS